MICPNCQSAIKDPVWRKQHAQAALWPRGIEVPIVRLWFALIDYAQEHRMSCGSLIGDDGVLGEHFAGIANGLLGLLDGECGRLDCGTIDREVRQLCRWENVEGVEQ